VTGDLAEVGSLSRRVTIPYPVPLQGRRLLAPRSHTRMSMGSPHGSLSPGGRHTGLPRSAYIPRWGRPCLYAGDRSVCDRTDTRALFLVTYLLVQAFGLNGPSTFGLSNVTALPPAVHFRWPYHLPGHPATGAGSYSLPSRLGCSLRRATLSRGLHTAGLLQPHASIGSRGRTPGQFLISPPTQLMSLDSYICDIVSQRFSVPPC